MSNKRQILLLRHAKSSWADPYADDYSRHLNERGRRAATAMGRQLVRLGLRPHLILCSSSTRTRETYKGLGESVEGIPVVFDDAIYEAAVTTLLEVLRQVDASYTHLMMIGHNPGMEHLVQLLANGQGNAKALARVAHKYQTGALAILNSDVDEWEKLGQGSCRLDGFMRPVDAD